MDLQRFEPEFSANHLHECRGMISIVSPVRTEVCSLPKPLPLVSRHSFLAQENVEIPVILS